MLITCIVAPLAIAAVLGFAFAERPATGAIPLGVSGASAPLVRAAVQAAQFPATVTVRQVHGATALRQEVDNGTLAGGVIVNPIRKTLANLMIPMVSPGGTPSPGFEVVDRPDSLAGQQDAQGLAASLASRLYLARLGNGRPSTPAAIDVQSTGLGNGSKAVLDYFAPSIAVIFLFIGSGLGMRSLLLERAQGTLVRMAAAPVHAGAVVRGKLLAVFLTGLTSMLVVWGATVGVFGADWGDPLGVLLICIAATAAMCGFGVLITSFARTEREAFGVSLIVGLVLALLGGNLLPPGALPVYLSDLSLGTPNGWALVGFGRLSLLHDSASAVVGPFLVLCLIAAITGGIAMTRVRSMVTP
jgi:ABC-2 type transport system permease protein